MRAILLITLVFTAACSGSPSDPETDPDLSGEARIEADAKSFEQAADEAARIVESDSAEAIAARRADTAAAAASAGAAAAAAGITGEQAGDGSRRIVPDTRRPSAE